MQHMNILNILSLAAAELVPFHSERELLLLDRVRELGVQDLHL